MWNGKRKAVTFSFDDGVTQDIRLIRMFDKYGLKCTFNLNSGFLGKPGSLVRNGVTVRHDKVPADRVREIYRGHEVAVHTLTHPPLETLDDAEIIRQVDEDRKNLEALVGYPIRGMAYPNALRDDHSPDVIAANTPIRYARSTVPTKSFRLQTKDLLRYHPTVHFIDPDLFALGEAFLALDPKEPSLFYIWGHSYEMDAGYISWERFEEFCEMISGQSDIFYGTNDDVLLHNHS